MHTGSILKDIKATNRGDKISYIIDIDGLVDNWDNLSFMSPKIGSIKREVLVENLGNNKVTIDPKDIRLYGIVQ
jgi:hypothetical protein